VGTAVPFSGMHDAGTYVCGWASGASRTWFTCRSEARRDGPWRAMLMQESAVLGNLTPACHQDSLRRTPSSDPPPHSGLSTRRTRYRRQAARNGAHWANSHQALLNVGLCYSGVASRLLRAGGAERADTPMNLHQVKLLMFTGWFLGCGTTPNIRAHRMERAFP